MISPRRVFLHSQMATPEFWVQSPTPAPPTFLALESQVASLCPGSLLCQMGTQESSPLDHPEKYLVNMDKELSTRLAPKRY